MISSIAARLHSLCIYLIFVALNTRNCVHLLASMRLQNDFGRCTHHNGIIGHIHIPHNRVGRNHHPMANVALAKHLGVRCQLAIVADNRQFVPAIERANAHNHTRR